MQCYFQEFEIGGFRPMLGGGLLSAWGYRPRAAPEMW